MPAADELERLTEAVDRLIVRLHSLKAERDSLAARVVELEGTAAVAVSPSRDEEGHNLLRLHSARLLRERQELRRRIAGVLEKLERMQR
jgi:type IV secretory pathway protease TraF